MIAIHKLIETEEEYEAALQRIDEIFHAIPGSPESDELKLLVVLVQKYEEEKYPLPPLDPIEAIEIRMEELSLSRKDLEPYLGDKSVVSKILNRKRDLTLDMVRRLHVALRLPAEVLIGQG
jgi:HTH-type transcriptional regulator / antitoxin HigA